MDATITTVCDYCGNGAVYRPSGISMTLYTHGVIVMEFFCVVCRLENHRVINVDLGQHLELVGVVTTIVHTPGELLEHPPADAPPIGAEDVDRIESMSLDVFNRLMEGDHIDDSDICEDCDARHAGPCEAGDVE